MEKSIEKIKQTLEEKRKHNIELLNKLKEKSILLNAEKEKQKRYFLNKSSTFLNKKRKNSNLIESDITTSQIKNNSNISYEMINAYEDFDEYYEDFMNNSFMTNKIFNNLNFCRPERFSLNKNKKKKLLIKNEEEFTIKKTIKPKEISKSINISFQSEKKDTTLKFILDKKNNDNDIKKNDKEISFFDINNNTKEQNEQNNTSLFKTPINNINNINNNNEKSLFSSNIPEKKETQIKNKDINNTLEKKEESKLFGNIERLNSIENKDKTLFGDINNDNNNNNSKEKTPTPKKEEKKESMKTSDLGLFATTLTPTPEADNNKKEKEEKKEINKNNETISLFNNNEKEKEKEKNKSLFNKEEKKEKIILPTLTLKPEHEEKEKENKENKDNKTSLFGNTNFNFSGSLFGNTNSVNNSLFQKKEENNINNTHNININMKENKEEKKETINFSIFNNDNIGNNTSNTNTNNNTNNMSSLFNNINNNNEKINEEPKSNISASNATGSLATKNNPFLNPVVTHNNLPSFFNVKNLNTNTNNPSSFNNNQPQQNFQGSIFNSNNQNNGSPFSSGTNIFGAPINNNNQKSLFSFPMNSGIGTGQGLFSNGNNFGSGFSLGKNIKTDG